jgi:hypothetical protein
VRRKAASDRGAGSGRERTTSKGGTEAGTPASDPAGGNATSRTLDALAGGKPGGGSGGLPGVQLALPDVPNAPARVDETLEAVGGTINGVPQAGGGAVEPVVKAGEDATEALPPVPPLGG